MEARHRPNLIDRTGRIYGRWTVLREADDSAYQCVKWLCRCECGVERSVHGNGLATGDSQSCGCLSRDNATKRATTHGGSQSRAYSSWANMIQRCLNPNVANFHNYGGRGITVCEQWLEFTNFLADMGHSPAGMSIERENNNGNYEPGNCKWATALEQSRNRRSSRMITFSETTAPMSVWAQKTGLPYHALKKRLNDPKWTLERAFTQPLRISIRALKKPQAHRAGHLRRAHPVGQEVYPDAGRQGTRLQSFHGAV